MEDPAGKIYKQQTISTCFVIITVNRNPGFKNTAHKQTKTMLKALCKLEMIMK